MKPSAEKQGRAVQLLDNRVPSEDIIELTPWKPSNRTSSLFIPLRFFRLHLLHVSIAIAQAR